MIESIAHVVVDELAAYEYKCEYDESQPLMYDNIITINGFERFPILSFDDEFIIIQSSDDKFCIVKYYEPGFIDRVLEIVQDAVLNVYYAEISNA